MERDEGRFFGWNKAAGWTLPRGALGLKKTDSVVWERDSERWSGCGACAARRPRSEGWDPGAAGAAAGWRQAHRPSGEGAISVSSQTWQLNHESHMRATKSTSKILVAEIFIPIFFWVRVEPIQKANRFESFGEIKSGQTPRRLTRCLTGQR